MNTLTEKVQLSCDSLFNQLYSLESILQFTKNVCQEKEFSSTYYNLKHREKVVLSEERNHYINMLDLALDRVSCIKEINVVLENEISEL